MPLNNSSTPSIKETIHKFWLNHAGVCIPFGVGCAWLGQGYPDRAEVKKRLQTFETCYGLGFRYYDTARSYGNSEWVVGEFVATIPRESIFLATKFNLPKVDSPRTAASGARECLEESLFRLKTDYLDLYQVHDSENLEVLFGEDGVLEFLLEAKRSGLIRNIGMAVREHPILEQALQREEFDTILTWGDFSPFNQSAAGLIEEAALRQVGVINGSPLYDARRHKLDLKDPRVLAAVLQFPMKNPAIDITLTGPANILEIEATVRALHETVDVGLWEQWKRLAPLPPYSK